MNSVILQIASRYLRVLLLSFAAIVLLRGHNYSGGGFIGGLLAALAVTFSSLAYSSKEVKDRLWIQPDKLIGIGLLLLVLSILPSVFVAEALMKGLWFTLNLPFSIELKLGTPFIFDAGVFFTVIGVALLFLFTLSTKK